MPDQPSPDPQLLVLTNRLPFVFEPGGDGPKRRPAPGGLVAALEPVLRKRGGTWIGWPGADFDESQGTLGAKGDPYQIRAVPLDAEQLAGHYHGFSNGTLWPLLHSLPSRTRFENHDWDSYRAVNEEFARIALEQVTDGHELVWIHDYHLMLVPALLRAQRPELRQAFFLHVPFPPRDVFEQLPWAEEILQALLGCDLIGFQVQRSVDNFLDCVQLVEGAELCREWRLVRSGDRFTRVGAFPIGIDWEHFEGLAKEPAPHDDTRDTPPERVLLGADRLDYTKGIPDRILAVERLLELHPEWREQVVLVQVAVPSRAEVPEYQALKRLIDELVGRVNGRFATASWEPIRYIYRSFPHEELAGMYRDADVAVVTPLRDGMNLGAKEFLAAQTEDPGVLVLSKFAGAAETMPEALLVNPNDLDATAEALHQALTMERRERAARMEALRERERQHDVHWWVETCIEAALEHW